MTDRVVEWEPEITNERPNELINWQSVPDSLMNGSDSVQFRRAPADGGTEHVSFDCRPGDAGGAILG